jgi:hypothetical protein
LIQAALGARVESTDHDSAIGLASSSCIHLVAHMVRSVFESLHILSVSVFLCVSTLLVHQKERASGEGADE